MKFQENFEKEIQDFEKLVAKYKHKNLTPKEFIDELNVFDLEKRKEILTAFIEIYKKDAHEYIYNQLMKYEHNYDWNYYLTQNLLGKINFNESNKKLLANRLFEIIKRFKENDDFVTIALDIIHRTINVKDIPKLFQFLNNKKTITQTIMILSKFTLDEIHEHKYAYHDEMFKVIYNYTNEDNYTLIMTYAFLNLVLSEYNDIFNAAKELKNQRNFGNMIDYAITIIKERKLNINTKELELL